jgi:hypothetical protein
VELCLRASSGRTISDDFLQAILQYMHIESCYTNKSFTMPADFLCEYALGREYLLSEVFVYFDARVNTHP